MFSDFSRKKGISSLRPEKCNSGNIVDKCVDCPISLGSAYDKEKIKLLETKISLLESMLERQKDILTY